MFASEPTGASRQVKLTPFEQDLGRGLIQIKRRPSPDAQWLELVL